MAVTNTDNAHRATIFTTMWAIAHLMHMWSQHGGRLDYATGWIVAIAAVWTLADPTDRRRLAVLAVVQVAEYVSVAPLGPDHWVILTAANLAILVSFALSKPLPWSTLRTILLIAYSAAALSKWNTEFLEVGRSCAAFLADIGTFGLLSPGPIIGQAAIAFSLIGETSIPLLLAFKRTRRLGIRVGVTFHGLVSLSPALNVGDFTVALFALFFLFLSDQELADLRETRGYRQFADAGRRVADKRTPALVGLLLAATTTGYLAPDLGASTRTMFLIVYTYMIVQSAWSTFETMPSEQSIGVPSAVYSIPIVLVFVMAASPYLGGRTTATFTMFSNLRTEVEDNHVFMPSFHPSAIQTSILWPTESNIPLVQNAIENGLGVPIFELRRVLPASPEIYVIGVVDDIEVRLGAGGEPVEPLNFWERNLMNFRMVPQPGVFHCDS